MSRIGKSPIPIPNGVMVVLEKLTVTVSGPKGELRRTLPEGVSISRVKDTLTIIPISDRRSSRERHGLCRTLIANMINGVSKGYEKKLETIGVGFRAQVKGETLIVSAGYSHPVEVIPPNGIKYIVENNTDITVVGTDKELVGNEAAKIRAIRPPEPYKGKGIRYLGERIVRKAGKSGKK